MNRDARVTTWKSNGAQFFKCFKWWSEQILIKDRCAATKWYHGNSVRVLGSYIWFSKLAQLKRTPIGQLFVIAAEVKTEIPDRMAEGCPKHNPWKGYTECHPVAAIFFCHPFAAIFFCHCWHILLPSFLLRPPVQWFRLAQNPGLAIISNWL